MDYWVELGLEEKVLKILEAARQSGGEAALDGHELAIELLKREPSLLQGTSLRLRGSSTESFGLYLAKQLSTRILHHQLPLLMRKVNKSMKVYTAPDGSAFTANMTEKFYLP
ncbi:MULTISPECIES: hypothetical protein [Thermoactinomyces]|jgi:hypothetical protein|uniref:Uncharacterized protein n=1 Tax=Thermoactinomyces daqus TaxID=1329516 RepID=A0A7W2AIT3_9BACL|nr:MULTISPECIES: hypothetical protein [Thermoactinomyces]MBA4543074.1 hypothetical protein [Thermoactinomyces daqus]MBH8596691.1 hypothetical protein [Thermoactinomyces sp. CICC 10523]MBH8603453.1 hypothetical protein [Thermoactinomyces sp. CICC 10522]MBH8606618.1 hypothetical protein [Thermoactinomyces sp. CICC 10521]